MELKNKIIKALNEYAVLAVEWGTEDDPEISLQEDYFEETSQEITELIMRDRYNMVIEYARLVGFAQGCLEGAKFHTHTEESKLLIKESIQDIDKMCDKFMEDYQIEEVE